MTEPWTTVQRDWMERDTETGWKDRRRDWLEGSAARLDFLAPDASRRNNGNGTTIADKFINFFTFLLHDVFFSFYNSCSSFCLFFFSLLLCEIVSGLKGGGGYAANN